MLRFVTTNEDKVEEAREYLKFAEVEQFDYDYVEIQSDSLEDVVAYAAEDAFEAAGGEDPVIVDDTGLFVDGLGGFPGPYAAYVEDTLGVERVWQLAEDLDDRSAHFECVIGYADGDSVETLTGVARGRIVAPRGDGGFGYDPIFEHDGKTFAEMSIAEKNTVSHRGRALTRLADLLAAEML